jgi:hypothetical protein
MKLSRLFATTLLILSFPANAQPAGPEITCINCHEYPNTIYNSFNREVRPYGTVEIAQFTGLLGILLITANGVRNNVWHNIPFALMSLTIPINAWGLYFGNEFMVAKRLLTNLFNGTQERRKLENLKGLIIAFIPPGLEWVRNGFRSEDIANNYLYFVAETNRKEDLEEALKVIKKSVDLPVKAVQLVFHGETRGMDIAEHDYITRGSQIIHFLRNLDKDTNIILNSCSVGSDEGLDPSSYNIAQSIAKYAGGRKVFASSGINVGACGFDENTLEPHFTTILGYIFLPFANFINYDAWLQQTKCYQFNKNSKTVVSCK